MIASPPSAWADAEREFHVAYLADATQFPRRSVAVAWVTRTDPSGGRVGLLVMGASAWRHGAAHSAGAEVTVTPDDDAGRSMAFSMDPGPTPLRRAGATTGVLVGGFGSNAICCLEVDGQVVWPTMNPIERPGPRRPG